MVCVGDEKEIVAEKAERVSYPFNGLFGYLVTTLNVLPPALTRYI